jgi:hypothetical protein
MFLIGGYSLCIRGVGVEVKNKMFVTVPSLRTNALFATPSCGLFNLQRKNL